MAISENIRFYKPNDPYYFEVDNLPLTDLLSNDKDLQIQVDSLTAAIQGISAGGSSNQSPALNVGRRAISELKPYTDSQTPNVIFVSPGNFTARMNTPATRPNGLWEGSTSKGTDQDTVSPSFTADRTTGHMPRTAVVQFAKEDIITELDQSIEIEPYRADGTELWWSPSTSNPAPFARLDLIYIQAFPSMDQQEAAGVLGISEDKTKLGRAQLGIIKGAGLISTGGTDNDGRWDDAGLFRKGKTMGGRPTAADPPTGDSYDDLNTLIDTVDWGTVPSPDDLNNNIVHWHNIGGVRGQFNGSSINSALNSNSGGLAGLPIAYVIVPQGPNLYLSESNIIDIRPFFRTTELTHNERSAVAYASKTTGDGDYFLAHAENPFVTVDELNVSLARTSQDILDQFPPPTTETITVLRKWMQVGGYLMVDGGVTDQKVINIDPAIRSHDRDKNIVAVHFRIRPKNAHGDIGNGYIGLENQRNDFHQWVMDWGNTIEHSSSILVQIVSFDAPPWRNEAGEWTVKTARSGSSVGVWWYIDGYTYEEEITVTHN